MATANTKAKTAKTEKPAQSPEEIEQAAGSAEKKEDIAVEEKKTADEAREKPIVARDIDPSQYVVVRNGFRGRLIYVSPRTGERFVWDDFGAEQDMELRELKSVKTSAKKFFTENWFLLDDWVIDYLGVANYYKNALRLDEFDELFDYSPDQIESRVSKLSSGQKEMVAYRAKEKIRDGDIDSLKVISALERALGIELIEK